MGASLCGAILEIPPLAYGGLTATLDQGPGPRMAGSLTGAVASQSVTEAYEGGLRAVGNRSSRAMA